MEYFIVFVFVVIILILWYCITSEMKYHALRQLQQKDYEFNMEMWQSQHQLNEEVEKEMERIKQATIKNRVAINDA